MNTSQNNSTERTKSLLTGTLASAALHALMLYLAVVSLRGCQQASSGAVGGEVFRDVGLFVVDGADGGRSDDGGAAGAGQDAETRDESTAAVESDQQRPAEQVGISDIVPREAPDLSSFLNIEGATDASATSDRASELPATIGPGVPIGGVQRSQSGGGGNQADQTTAGGSPRIGGVPGSGETTFMNIAGVGKTVVYVIDTSSSMDGNRLKVAQGQLKASLRLLQPEQKFAVILYNEIAMPMTLRGRAKQTLYSADDLSKSLAAQEVDRILSDSGTQHKPALLMALGLKPDVVYFLTDGDQPELYSDDLEEVRRKSGSTTIHVIKFGDGSVTDRTESWLEKLASQSGGEFREINAK